MNFSHGFHVGNRCSGRPVPQVRAQPATQAGGQRISTAQKSLPGLSHVHKKSKAAALIVEQATDGTTCHSQSFFDVGENHRVLVHFFDDLSNVPTATTSKLRRNRTQKRHRCFQVRALEIYY